MNILSTLLSPITDKLAENVGIYSDEFGKTCMSYAQQTFEDVSIHAGEFMKDAASRLAYIVPTYIGKTIFQESCASAKEMFKEYCVTAFDDLECASIKASASITCTALTALNGGLVYEFADWIYDYMPANKFSFLQFV